MKKPLNLFIPQWQDSGFAQLLWEGAIALRDYIKSKNIVFSEISVSLSTDLKIDHNIVGYHTIVKQLNDISNLLDEKKPEKLFCVGGGCGIEIPLVSYLAGIYNNLQVVWFDAHGDINTPDSSPSKYFHGMPLRFLLENISGNEISGKYNNIKCDNVVLIGTRDLDAPEQEYIYSSKIKMIKPEKPEIKPETILEKMLNGKNKHAYLHIDLDVLDPEIYKNVKCPVENGYTVEQIIQMINFIKSEMTVVGMSLLENTETKFMEISKLDGLIDIGTSL
ncbi:arginase family protein [candidate division KSB1 bacterium]|nr:arginase family protein [candidate division KSB1 bacterium]